MRMTDLSDSRFGFTLGPGDWGDWRKSANRSIAAPALGGFNMLAPEVSFRSGPFLHVKLTLVVSMLKGRISDLDRPWTMVSSSTALQTM